MYSALLIAHSWLRWLAIGGVVVVIIRAFGGISTGRPSSRRDAVWTKIGAHTITLQALIGIALYVTSPYVAQLRANMGASMHDRVGRLFAVEHEVMMILALAFTHIGSAVARRAPTDHAKHVRAMGFFLLALSLMFYAMPWMRPMFRMGS
ncbi:MAG TPA: hypothetical protein VE967_06920 [Gemmatimonadaceae bacterium]|nr:hypothetical protein [Gemmatimonadaceae bacterium]